MAGGVGVRDREGYEQLRTIGIPLGQNPFDYYSLETSDDVIALRDLLKRHRDSTAPRGLPGHEFSERQFGFPKDRRRRISKNYLMPLSRGLPGSWKRPGLFEAYRQGILDGVFIPGLYGLTQFCRLAAERALTVPGDRNNLLHTLWKAETPYIRWRMPWIGYEYYNPEKPQAGFLDAEAQARLIAAAGREFKKIFHTVPRSACAPGHWANQETHRAWSDLGVRVAQNGQRGSFAAPHG